MKKVLIFVALLVFIFTAPIHAIEIGNSAEKKEYEVQYIKPNMVTTHSNDEYRVDFSSNATLENRGDAGKQLVYFPTSYCNTQYEVIEFTDSGVYNIGCTNNLEVTNYNVETFAIIENGRIVYSNNAIVSTLGGKDYIAMMYPTTEDAYNQTNGVTINGGAYTGQYLGTVTYNNEKFIHLNIGGYIGYMDFSEVQILPMPLVEAQTYYSVDGDDWVKYIANDPLDSSKGYVAYPIDEAPEFAEEGVKYYSSDDETFYPNNPTMTINSRKDVKYSDGNYFQDLPVRSTSSYTGADYKSYLTYINKTSSEYYNSTAEFVNMQNSENVNSLIMFSWANHESAYGTSSLAKSCHNFWGWNAPDSDPSQCQNSTSTTGHYGDVRSGIHAQGFNVPTHFLDVSDWRYYGGHLGNKQAGINAYYASDPDWGSLIASMAYQIDEYLGGYENDLYRIAELTTSASVYKTSELGNGAKVVNNAGETYTIKKGGTGSSTSGSGIHVIVTDVVNGSKGTALEIQLDTALNYSGSTTCNQTKADYGYYPAYNGNYTVSNVDTGEFSYACDYAYEYSRGWIYASNTKIIHDNEIFVPGDKLVFTPTTSSYSVYINEQNLFNLHEGYYPVVSVVNSDKTNEVIGYEILVDSQTGVTGYTKKEDVQFDIPYYSVYETTLDNTPVAYTPGGSVDYHVDKGTKFVVINKINPGPIYTCPNGSTTSNWIQVYKDDGWEIGYIPDCYVVDDLGTTPYLNGFISSLSLDGTNLYLSGVAYMQYVYTGDYDHSYSLVLSSSANSYEYSLGECTNTSTTSTYSERDGVDYSVANFCQSEPIDLTNVQPGSYKINIKMSNRGYISTREMPVKLPNKTYKYVVDGYEYKLVINNETATFTKTSLVAEPAYLNGYIEKVTLNGTKLNIEGPAYIQYLDAKDYEHSYTMTLKNTSYEYNYPLGICTKTVRMSEYSERDNIDYSKGYFCTSGGSGVDISNIAPGTYDIYITYKDSGYEATKKMTANMGNKTLSYKDGKGYEYIVTIKDKKITVTKKELIPDDPYLNGYIEKVTLNGTKLNIEGPGYVQYLPANNYEHSYTMTLKNASYEYNYSLGICTKTDRMSEYSKRDNIDYSKGYFCTSGGSGVDISNIAPGTYDIYVTYKDSGYEATKKMTANMSNKTLSYKDGKGYEYIVTIKDKKITVTKKDLIPDDPYLNGYIEKVTLNGTKLNIEGPAYIQYLSANDYNHHYTMTLKNDSNSYDYPLGVCTKTDRMSEYSNRDKVDYSKGYFCTSGGSGVDISNIAPGTYDIYVTYEEEGYSATKKMTASMANKTLTYEANDGYEYKVVVKDKKISVTKG